MVMIVVQDYSYGKGSSIVMYSFGKGRQGAP